MKDFIKKFLLGIVGYIVLVLVILFLIPVVTFINNKWGGDVLCFLYCAICFIGLAYPLGWLIEETIKDWKENRKKIEDD